MGFFDQMKTLFKVERPDYATLIQNGAKIIDVRSPQEYNSSHAKGSINIPLNQVTQKAAKYKNQTLILVCQSGMRASQAKGEFERAGATCYNAGNWRNV